MKPQCVIPLSVKETGDGYIITKPVEKECILPIPAIEGANWKYEIKGGLTISKLQNDKAFALVLRKYPEKQGEYDLVEVEANNVLLSDIILQEFYNMSESKFSKWVELFNSMNSELDHCPITKIVRHIRKA